MPFIFLYNPSSSFFTHSPVTQFQPSPFYYLLFLYNSISSHIRQYLNFNLSLLFSLSSSSSSSSQHSTFLLTVFLHTYHLYRHLIFNIFLCFLSSASSSISLPFSPMKHPFPLHSSIINYVFIFPFNFLFISFSLPPSTFTLFFYFLYIFSRFLPHHLYFNLFLQLNLSFLMRFQTLSLPFFPLRALLDNLQED